MNLPFSTIENIIEQLQNVLEPGSILTGEEVTGRRTGSWGQATNVKAQAILRPKTTREVSDILKICNDAKQPVIVHGGLTGLVQATSTTKDDVVLSLELMNQIEEIDATGRTATVQAGVVLQRLQQAVEKVGLMFPLDLGARGSCQIGGNIATNAGGVRVLRYGVTREQVLGLEVVLADGAILSSLNKTIKNNSGYDLKQLFVGSEGTLGIITRAVLRLQPQPKSQDTAFVALNEFKQLPTLLKFMDESLGGTLSAFELMWRSFYELVTTEPAKSKPPLPYDYPYYVLLESLGANKTEDSARFEKALAEASQQGLIEEAIVAHTREEHDTLWVMRDDVDQIWRYSPVFLFDVSLAIKDMEDYVLRVEKDIAQTWPEYRFYVFGHMGDGNLHLFVSAGSDDEETRRKVEEIVYKPLVDIGGAVSAEHGIGLEKKAYLPWCRTEAELALMRTLKKTLDPTGILNPGRIFDV